jgi:hypothetical protein
MTALFSTSLSGPLVVGFLLGSGVTCVAIQAIAYAETRALRGVFLLLGREKQGCAMFLLSFRAASVRLKTRTTKRFQLSRCASAIHIVRPLESIAEMQPQLQPALLRLSAMISQYRFTAAFPRRVFGSGDHYVGDVEARQKLRITKTDWSRLGELANDAPLKEGRHRGGHSELRHATAAELDQARKIARCLIEEFANQL